MARVFISHSSRDSQQATEMLEWLRRQGFDRAFLDIDKHAGIPPGARWERQLYQEISMIEQEHVTHYESMLDAGENWWERLLTHEYNECWLYYSFMQQESDPRIKAIWELLMALSEIPHFC